MPDPTPAPGLESLRCPSCGGEMHAGYIAGQAMPLRWTQRPNAKTVFEGEPLNAGSLTGSASLEAVRCERCRLGVFRYG
jgi:hypothetical protein